MSRNLLVAMILLLVGAPLSLALGARYLAVIGIEGTVNVDGDVAVTVREVPVKLDIDEPTGVEKIKNITTITIQEGWAVRFKVIEKDVEGNVSMVLNGVAVLRGGDKVYKIPLPCLLAHGEGCYRIQKLIPGYDTPLPLPPGTYVVDLVLEWSAGGRGRFTVKLAIELHKHYTVEPEIKVVGARPGDTERWITVPGSTKTYALMVEETNVEVGDRGTGSLRAYAWVFAGNKKPQLFFRFKLLDAITRQVVADLVTRPYRTGMYHSVLVEVRAPPGTYLLRLEVTGLPEPVILEIPVEFHK